MKILSRENCKEKIDDIIGKKILVVSNDTFNDLINFAYESKYLLDDNIFENKKFPLAFYFCLDFKPKPVKDLNPFRLKRYSDDDVDINSFSYIWVFRSNSKYEKKIDTEVTVDKVYKKESTNINDLADLPVETLKNIIDIKSEKIIAKINNLFEELNELGVSYNPKDKKDKNI